MLASIGAWEDTAANGLHSLSSNKSYLIDFIDAKNRDLTVPLRGFFSMFAARQRTGERRSGI